jgi:hypothetical protein
VEAVETIERDRPRARRKATRIRDAARDERRHRQCDQKNARADFADVPRLSQDQDHDAEDERDADRGDPDLERTAEPDTPLGVVREPLDPPQLPVGRFVHPARFLPIIKSCDVRPTTKFPAWR